MEKIIAKLHKTNREGTVPSIVFTKGGGLWLEKIAASGCDAIGLDWTVNIADAKKRVGDKVALQGNLDPSVLYASPEIIKKEALKVLNAFDGNTGHVFNLGHGIHPDINPEHLKVLIDTVKNYHD
jgi:uroporphyrinogen decarboxylase